MDSIDVFNLSLAVNDFATSNMFIMYSYLTTTVINTPVFRG